MLAEIPIETVLLKKSIGALQESMFFAIAETFTQPDESAVLDDMAEDMARKAYTADFETTVDLDDCRVWAAAVCEVGNIENIERGTSIEWFMRWCENNRNVNVYFHNLGFDGAFIMDWLERSSLWSWTGDRHNRGKYTYGTVISDANVVYCIELHYGKGQSVRIMDSLRIAPLSVAALAKAYDLPMLKGSIDYTAERDAGHELTAEEIAYIDNDVKITALVMERFLAKGLTRMTAGSNALSDYKAVIGGAKCFRKWFPLLDDAEDAFIRNAYRGGFTYVKPEYRGKRIGSGVVLDVNSLYPSVMYGCDGERLPYGKPVYFRGKPEKIDAYPLWIAQLTCSFRLRERHIPCIQMKGNFRFNQAEYLEKSDGTVTFTITNVDWELMKRQYHIYNLRWHCGFYFKSADFLFRKYIDKWLTVKNQATIDGNGGLRQISKLMLNSLYGKFATRTTMYSRRPMLVNDVLRFVDLEPEQREPVYLPVGVFVTSWARAKTVSAAQSVYDRFVYADTDSLHLVGDELPAGLSIDDVQLGAWKHETDFWQAKFLRAKCYIEYEQGNDSPTVRVAGMPSRCHSQVSMDNFDYGAVYEGKLYTRRVEGGIVLVEDKMEIRV